MEGEPDLLRRRYFSPAPSATKAAADVAFAAKRARRSERDCPRVRGARLVAAGFVSPEIDGQPFDADRWPEMARPLSTQA